MLETIYGLYEIDGKKSAKGLCNGNITHHFLLVLLLVIILTIFIIILLLLLSLHCLVTWRYILLSPDIL